MNASAAMGPRLLVDCTFMLAGHHYTGIQRHVRRTLRHARRLWGPARTGALTASQGQWRELALLPAHPLEELGSLTLSPSETSTPAQLTSHTHVLLADRFWHTGEWGALDTLLRSPAQICAVVYDLLSVRNPQWFAPGVGERFARYLRLVLPRANSVVCLSRTAATDLTHWADAQGLQLPDPQIVAPGHEVWHGPPAAPGALPASWRDGSTPFVLQVGTLEPRKNHALTLAALQEVWAAGASLGCLFIGQRGWLMDGFADALRQLPQWQRELVWLTECTDAQLDWCYRHAAAVLYPSAGEGYGLPLAEAASAGARVIASDTAVHREVVARLGSRGPCVQLCPPTPHAVAAALQRCTARPTPAPGPLRGWAQATQELLDAMGLDAQTV